VDSVFDDSCPPRTEEEATTARAAVHSSGGVRSAVLLPPHGRDDAGKAPTVTSTETNQTSFIVLRLGFFIIMIIIAIRHTRQA
jgi:hypothetical protein